MENKKIEYLFGNNEGRIEIVVTDRNKAELKIIYDDGWKAEYPIIYDDYQVAYDHPEDIPESLKDFIRENSENLKNKIDKIREA